MDFPGQLSVPVDLSRSRSQDKGFPVPIRNAVSHLGHGIEETEWLSMIPVRLAFARSLAWHLFRFAAWDYGLESLKVKRS